MDKEFTEWFEKHRDEFYSGEMDVEQIAFMAWQAAQQSVQATVATPWACPSCSHENHAMAIKCYFCDATAPNA